MVVDSGCTRTLVHERFMVDKDSFTGDEITVLTASGERVIVPLAWVQFESDQGEHLELVGVLSKLPVDCLLGRSSFGQTLSRDDVLRQWEKNVSVDGSKGVEAFVLTRRQRRLKGPSREPIVWLTAIMHSHLKICRKGSLKKMVLMKATCEYFSGTKT